MAGPRRGTRTALRLLVMTAVALATTPVVPSTAGVPVRPGLVSVPFSGSSANGASVFPSIDAAGNVIAFRSEASDLVPGDANTLADVFVRYTTSNQTTCASVATSGVPGDGPSGAPDISSDARFVVFESSASDLVPGDSNAKWDVFRRDLVSGETTLVSSGSAGQPADGDSRSPSVSSDGRYVAFVSGATDIVSGDTNGYEDVFVRDMQSMATVRASVSATGTQLPADSSAPAISGDGRRVAFVTVSGAVVAGDTNGVSDVFVRDLDAMTTVRASISSTGDQGNLGSFSPASNRDGTVVAFESMATNLVSADENGVRDIIVRDFAAGTTVRASLSSSGSQADAGCQSPSLSEDGRYVAFSSAAATLVHSDRNEASDVFLHDLGLRRTSRLSVSVDGWELMGGSYSPSLNASGTVAALHSFADGVAPGDANGAADVMRVAVLERRYVRVQGQTRYGTAVQASVRAFPTGADSAVLATGRNWPDALGGAALAGAVGGPVLLTDTAKLPAEVARELGRLRVKRVYILGRDKAVSAGVEAALVATLGAGNVVRLGGSTRYETASEVASRAIAISGAGWDGTVVVATGRNYPDALAVSPLSYAFGWPIVLTSASGSPALPPGTLRAVIVGGTMAVPASVEMAIRSALGTSSVERLSGLDRYSTAAAIANRGVFGGLDRDGMSIATGEQFPDGLSGGAMNGRLGSVMVLTRQGTLPAASQGFLRAHESRIATVHVLGGTSAVAEAVIAQARKLLQ